MGDQDADAVEVVRRGYDRLSDRYRSDGEEPEEYRRWIDELLTRLAPASRVLDLGCGNGIPVARRLVDAGHIVTGVDLSDRQIDRARRLVPEASFLRADITVHDLGIACFDGIVALYSLIHLPLDRQPAVIAKMGDALTEGGVVLSTVGWDAWTRGDPDWLGGGAAMWWSHTDHATYRRWFEQAGMEVERVEHVAEGATMGHALLWARRLPAVPDL
jgi:SAM-dependent methyltransferase